MTIGQRIALTLVIILVILFALAFVGWISGGWDAAAQRAIVCSDDAEAREQVRKTTQSALTEALHNQVEHLFSIWMKDETGQPQRAATGVRQAAKGYLHARTQIAKWDIPPC